MIKTEQKRALSATNTVISEVMTADTKKDGSVQPALDRQASRPVEQRGRQMIC